MQQVLTRKGSTHSNKTWKDEEGKEHGAVDFHFIVNVDDAKLSQEGGETGSAIYPRPGHRGNLAASRDSIKNIVRLHRLTRTIIVTGPFIAL